MMELSKIGRSFALTVICLILGIMLAWQYKSINNSNNLTQYENKRIEDLKDEIIELQNKNNSLQVKIQELIERSRLLESQGDDAEIFRKDLEDRLMKARIFAGLEPVKGPGLIITISNGKLFNVQDDDILSVINELRAADAQAISIKDERVVATTEVRSVSNSYIMVNGKQMVSPFVIKAIGDPDKMEHSLKMIGGVIEDISAYVDVTVERSDSITIPAIRDDGTVIKTDLLVPLAE
jgi:uncharacterized protein YlxW (UPF0749 family)